MGHWRGLPSSSIFSHLSLLSIQGTLGDRDLTSSSPFSRMSKNRGPRRRSGLPKVTRLVWWNQEFHPCQPDGKNGVVEPQRCHHTWKPAVLLFAYAHELGPRPLCPPTGDFADALGRSPPHGPESLCALVANCLPHHKMVNSPRVFMFPGWGLAAVTWKREWKFLRQVGDSTMSEAKLPLPRDRTLVLIILFIRSFFYSTNTY